MSDANDLTDAIRERVTGAFDKRTPLSIQGNGSKAFLGEPVTGATLQLCGHSGIIDYQPAELVITARSGTPLAEVEAALAEHNQMLAFEPPHLDAHATLGGTLAAGLSGPRRPYAGSARDFVLGTRIINGRGQRLRFGGEVMKNVAGYDLSRLMVGSMGTLGVIMDISLKVLPRPAYEQTRVSSATQTDALARMNQLAGQPLPLSGAYWEAGRLHLRFSGARQAVEQACKVVGGRRLDDADFWTRVREMTTPFFADADKLWRLSLPPATPPLDLERDVAVDWGGAQRWLKADIEAGEIRAITAEAGGHASLFRGDGQSRCQPLATPLLAIHKRLKQAMDPAGILNPGRLFPDF